MPPGRTPLYGSTADGHAWAIKWRKRMVRSRVRRLLRAVARRARRLLDDREGRLTREAQELVDAGVFDADWYRVQRPHLTGDAPSLARDYLTDGRYFGFTPNPLFIPRLVNRKSWRT